MKKKKKLKKTVFFFRMFYLRTRETDDTIET